MRDLESIQARLSEIPCPVCRKPGCRVRETGEKGYAEDFCAVQCTHCAYHYPISIPTRPVKETDPDTDIWLKGLPCPSCEEQGAELDFRGKLSVRETLYFITCRNCRHSFHEKAPMEAYE